MRSVNEINALIQLLDDTDQEVFNHVYNKLKSFGPEVIPNLEQAWSVDLNPTAHDRIEEIIHDIQFDVLVKEWKIWLSNESPDLLTGAYLIAKYHYPETNIDQIRKNVLKIKQSIWLELNYNQTPLEQIQIFNQVFYNYHSFKGVQLSNEFKDCCINHVLESKQGTAISVGIVYQILANELNLPVYGVNLMQHYILAFCKRNLYDFTGEQNLEREVMFYINPINRGSVFSRAEIKDYLQKMKEEEKSEYFIPTATPAILKELLNYLMRIYTEKNEIGRGNELGYLAKLLN